MPLRQKATAARPPANSSVAAAAPVARPSGPVSVEILGQQLRDVLPPRRLQSVSLCDHEANVLWLSEGALGPDEHTVVVEALALLSTDTALPSHELGLEDGRHALFLPVRTPTADLVGIAMILADSRTAGDDTMDCMMGAPVRAIMQRLAVLMKPGDKRTARAEIPVLELSVDDDGRPAAVAPAAPRAAPPAAASRPAAPPARAAPARAAPARAASAPPAATAPPSAGLTQVITPEEINDILEFSLSPEETPAPVSTRAAGPASAPAPAAAKSRAVAPARGVDETSSMMSLEFVADAAGAPPAAPPVIKPAAAVRPPPPPAPVRAAARAPAAAAPASARATPAPAPAPRPSAAPAAAAPAAQRNLRLEVLPFSKLRAGGQSRRFQVLVRPTPREAQRDPASLDALALQHLVTWLAANRAAWNSQPTSFTLNLSIATLEDERFAHRIAATLNAGGLAAETLGFEIAEALCTQRRAQVERFINHCDKLGSWVAIDDFSFDSQVLPLLRSKALRLVKLDAKLTTSALKDKLSQALVVATVQAAKVMGIHCAAKNVDSQAAVQWLGAIGCDFAQGPALSPAQPLESLANPGDPTARPA